jgi:autotransporter translocation and assembly factor TamB
MIKAPLEKQGISYQEIQGSLLSGFEILDVNYQEKVKAQRVTFQMNLNALKEKTLLIDTLEVDKLEIEQQFLHTLLENNQSSTSEEEQNLSLPFDNVVINNVQLSLSNIIYEEYVLNEMNLSLKDVKSNLKESHEGSLELFLNSNVAKAKLRASLEQNYLKIEGGLEGEHLFINRFLEAQKIEVEKNPQLTFHVNGDLNQSNIVCHFTDLKAKQGEFWADIKHLNLKADVTPQKGDIKLKVLTHFNSFVAEGNIDGDIHFNAHDLNQTLFTKLHSSVEIDSVYLNGFLEEHNVTLLENMPLDIDLKGNMKAVDIDVNSSSKLMAQGINSQLRLQTEGLHFDLIKNYLRGALNIEGEGEALAFNLQSDVDGDYTDFESLKLNSKLALLKLNSFNVDLSSLTPIQVNMQKHEKVVTAQIESEKLKLSTRSNDLDQFSFSLESNRIYPAKIVTIPEALEGKYLSANLNGSTTLSKKLLSVEGDISSNKNFKLNLALEHDVNGLDAKVSSKYFTAMAKGNIEQKEIDFNTEVQSLKKLQKEIQKIYEFEAVPIEGKVALSGSLKGEYLNIKLNSDKFVYEALNVKEIEVDASYEKDLITVNTLEFILADKKNPQVAQDFYLTKTATIALGQRRDIELEMYPKISLYSTGTETQFKTTLQIDALKLQHPSYGGTELTCNIDYIQNAKKKKVLGGIYLDKLNILYESKFLDPSHDGDVIIVTKKRQKDDTSDGFSRDMEIDLKVYAEDATYKTRDIDLQFTVNVDVDKQRQKDIRLLGRIEEIQGEVEQAPKLFKVEESNIVFTGAKEINPLLDLSVEYALPEVLIRIDIRGNAKRPKLLFSSEPSLPKKDILSYLLLGVSTANVVEGEGSLSREAELFIMNQAARDLAQDVELDHVFIKDDGTGEGYDVQVGKKINDETMFVIEKNREGNSFILEYDINKNMKVEVGQHQKVVPSQSIDFYYRKKFK